MSFCLIWAALCLAMAMADGEGPCPAFGAPPAPLFTSNGELRLKMVLNGPCEETSVVSTLVHGAAWLSERINILEMFSPLRLGIDVFGVCSDKELLNLMLAMPEEQHFVDFGTLTFGLVDDRVKQVSSLLNRPITECQRHHDALITATVRILSVLQYNGNLTVHATDNDLLSKLLIETMGEGICITKIIKKRSDLANWDPSQPMVFFGNREEMLYFIDHHLPRDKSDLKLIIVPTDSSKAIDFPENSLVILPIYSEPFANLTRPFNVIPSPLFLEQANCVLNRIHHISIHYRDRCTNSSSRKATCLQAVASLAAPRHIPYQDTLRHLRLQSLFSQFNYRAFRVERMPESTKVLNLVASFNVVNRTLDPTADFFGNRTNFEEENAFDECLNFGLDSVAMEEVEGAASLGLRQESWAVAVLAVAGIGVLFCLAIAVFIFVRMCKKDILEGNPLLTIVLLFCTMGMFCAVVPFALEVKGEPEGMSNALCLSRMLSLTLSYSCVFSLMLGRSVMLATVAHEAGFMSHIAGHVQALLSVFMCAVQGALSLQLVDHCADLFAEDNSILFVLSYDVLLLGLLLCAAPFVCTSQRNYREGLYFTVATLLISVTWTAWVTAYLLVTREWSDLVLCAGLLLTASDVVAAVFVPRTYMMTSAIVRDSLASTLPSMGLGNSASILDLNYRNSQHVYDCVNIATINSLQQITNSSAPPREHHSNPNFYAEEPDLPLPLDQPDLVEEACHSPDKITRF